MDEEPTKRTVPVVTALVEREGKWLITQRRQSAVFPLYWEFPGGRREPGESNQDALRRELKERLGADVEVGELLNYERFEYEAYELQLHVYSCTLLSDRLAPLAVKDYRWVRSKEFDDYEFTPADEASVSKLLGESQDPPANRK